MTSKLTREQLHERARENVKALKLASRQTAFESAREEILADLQLAELALAAIDQKPASEPITVTDDMAYAFHHALTDSMIGADDVEEIKTGLRAVFANLTAPVVSAKYPDRLPCSVLLEPGLRFGKGIKTSTMLAALARRAVYESDMAALSQEERAEFQARIEDFKALIAQPVPVVPDEIKKRLPEILRTGKANRWEIHDLAKICAMLSAAPQLQNAPQNIPEIIPDCWCRTCRPVVLNDMRFVVCPDCGNKRCPRANDHRNACTGSNEPGQEGGAYPDIPREVK
ncbi:hypothetical protein [Klebsiella variicola]|uniref:hypothetical protein n=1 Tax=Klebsiella variicola TaxID=244366 RepID=UPI002F967689